MKLLHYKAILEVSNPFCDVEVSPAVVMYYDVVITCLKVFLDVGRWYLPKDLPQYWRLVTCL